MDLENRLLGKGGYGYKKVTRGSLVVIVQVNVFIVVVTQDRP